MEYPCSDIRSARELLLRRFATAVCASVASVSAVVLVRSNDGTSNNARALAKTGLGASSAFLALLGFGSGGPRWSPLYNLLGIRRPVMKVRGTVEPGYEPVLEQFKDNLRTGQDDGVQFAAYVKGKCVVDLAGSVVASTAPNDRLRHYAEDSYTCCWSSSKVLESAVMAWLVDRGHISYDTKIQDVWPEFNGGGKEQLTLRDIMKHEAGLKEVPSSAPVLLEELLPESIKAGHISRRIEGWECKYPDDPKQKREYHALTRGMLSNEIARRVDPKGRTMGEIFREEFTMPLGIDKECYAGVPRDLSDPSTNAKLFLNTPPARFIWIILHKLSCMFGIDNSRWDSDLLLTVFMLHLPLRWTRWKEFVNPNRKTLLDFAATPIWYQGESPSCNVCTSARALAAVGNVLSRRDPDYFRGNGLEKALAGDDPKPMFEPSDLVFNDGGWAHFTPKDRGLFGFHKLGCGIDNVIGWSGWNGSCLFFHPGGDFAVAFNPTAFGDFALTPTSRLGRLVSAFAECALASNGDKWAK